MNDSPTPQVALVTGACSGIGLEIARELARRGYTLVLVSDRGFELAHAADRLSNQHGVATHCIEMDLARPQAAQELYEAVQQLELEVGLVVNNAGMLLFGEVAETPAARAEAMLYLHVVTPSLLALLFGRDMRARRKGHMLFVSSASSWCDFPGVALYGSTKRYLRSFSAAIREELRPWGVNVTCLAPGAVATSLFDCTSGAAATGTRLGLVGDPARVARAAVRGMLRRRALVLPGLSARLMAVGSALTPRWLVRLVRTRTDYLPRPKD